MLTFLTSLFPLSIPSFPSLPPFPPSTLFSLDFPPSLPSPGHCQHPITQRPQDTDKAAELVRSIRDTQRIINDFESEGEKTLSEGDRDFLERAREQHRRGKVRVVDATASCSDTPTNRAHAAIATS
jgi:hypothetical protein